MASTRDKVRFIGAEVTKMKPTKKHRPAVWENMLGTVSAANDDGVVKYFGHDHGAALEYAGVNDSSDPRLWKHTENIRFRHRTESGGYYEPEAQPRRGQLVLWVTR